jgi:hypothetical protein
MKRTWIGRNDKAFLFTGAIGLPSVPAKTVV